MLITKDNDYIEDRGDHYSIPILNVNDSLKIDLDKRLHVESSVFVAGDLDCGDIVVDGLIVVNGNVVASGVQAHEIYFMRNANISGNVLSRTNAQFGRTWIGGSMISNGNVLALSDLSIIGDLSVAVSIHAKGNLKAAANVSIGAMLDVSGEFVCKKEAKIAGSAITTYGKYSDGLFTIVVTDTVIIVGNSKGVADVYDDIDEKLNDLENGEFEHTERDASLYRIIDWVKKIPVEIRKEEQ